MILQLLKISHPTLYPDIIEKVLSIVYLIFTKSELILFIVFLVFWYFAWGVSLVYPAKSCIILFIKSDWETNEFLINWNWFWATTGSDKQALVSSKDPDVEIILQVKVDEELQEEEEYTHNSLQADVIAFNWLKAPEIRWYNIKINRNILYKLF